MMSYFLAICEGMVNTPFAHGLRIVDVNATLKDNGDEVYIYTVTVKNTNNVVFHGDYTIYCKMGGNDSWLSHAYAKISPGESEVHFVASQAGPKLEFEAKLREVNLL